MITYHQRLGVLLGVTLLCAFPPAARAQDAPAVQFLVHEEIVDGQATYRYTVVNNGERPITTLFIGHDAATGEFELEDVPLGWTLDSGLPSGAAAGPAGWLPSLFIQEESDFVRLQWNTDPLNRSFDLPVGQTLGAFSVVVAAPAPTYLSTHWMVVFDDGGAESGLLERAPAPPANGDLTGTISPGGPPVTLTFDTQGQNARLLFGGAAGERVSLVVDGVTVGGASIFLIGPDGTPLSPALRAASSGSAFMDATVLPAAGTYTIVVDPDGTSTGDVRLTLYAVPPDVMDTLEFGMPATIAVAVPGQNARLMFNGVAGRRIVLQATSVTIDSSTVRVLDPDGTTLTFAPVGTGGAILPEQTLPVTGAYTLLVDGFLANTGNMTLTLHDLTDVTAVIMPGGPAVTVTTTVPGQHARITFAGNAGQRVSLLLSSVTFGTSTCCSATLTILNPDGTALVPAASFGTAGRFIGVRILGANGTHTILLAPDSSATGSATLTLYDVPPDVTGTLVVGGPAVTVTMGTPGQNSALTFSGIAGQKISLTLTNSTFPSASVKLLQPNGTTKLTTEFGTSGAFIDPVTLPEAGTYTILVDPTGTYTGTVTLILTNSVDPPPGRMNVALTANGGQAVASSTYGSAYPASSLTNGDRRGVGWGNGGGWADGTTNSWPDWVEVRFSGPQSIEEIDVFTVQDSYSSPAEPTLDMTFSGYGVRDFVVEYWTETGWQPVPGGGVADNTRVWRQFRFLPVTTSRIRVFITDGLASNSRLTEIEAYAVLGTENLAPSVTLLGPGSGDIFTVSALVSLEAMASDAEGSVQRVEFYANDVLVATSTTGIVDRYAATWSPGAAGSYSITAVATDDRGATKTSAPASITVTPAGRRNVAQAAHGGRAVASSTFGSGYPESSIINGDRRGVSWGNGGGWADGTTGTWPDWIEMHFNGTQVIEEIDLFTVQDNYSSPSEPTLGMTFTKYGVRDFVVEYWTGSAWQPIPGGQVVDNTFVWSQFYFAPVTTSRIRVYITEGLASNSRLTEIEAYAVAGSENNPPTVTLTSPAPGATSEVSSPIALEATARDFDGTVSLVDFYVNDTLLATDTAGTGDMYSATWVPAVAGTYIVTAVARDDRGASRTSNAVTVTVTPPPGRTNVALAINGGVAVASSSFGTGYPASSLTNGDRKGLGWGSGGGWADGTTSVWPDWVEVQFDGVKVIEQVDVFTVQDNPAAPSEPTLGMTFTKYGVRDFVVEYWTGTAWEPVPGGIVTGNANVWRQFNFPPVSTQRIRVFINHGLGSNSRLTEIEVYATLPQ